MHHVMSLRPKAHMYGAGVFHFNLHLWQNGRDLLVHAIVVHAMVDGYQSESHHRKRMLEKKNSPTAPAGTWTHNLLITSPAL